MGGGCQDRRRHCLAHRLPCHRQHLCRRHRHLKKVNCTKVQLISAAQNQTGISKIVTRISTVESRECYVSMFLSAGNVWLSKTSKTIVRGCFDKIQCSRRFREICLENLSQNPIESSLKWRF